LQQIKRENSMKAAAEQQNHLIELADLDSEMTRNRAALANLTTGELFALQRQNQRDAAAKLIEARNALDSVELEFKRADADLLLVEQRIEKDKQKLNQTTSPKDAQGIQSELESLAKRKSELEDFELSVMEKKEQCELALAEITKEKQLIDQELSSLENANEQEILKLRSGLELTGSKRVQLTTRIDQDLVELYESKLRRGIAAARLLNRECGACRMTIGATALAEIVALPSDEVATCPDCQAILIR
jgi:predicted  nucleic acid-binding Zn-ribbon protein